MELMEAAQRIVRVRGLVLLACVVIGAVAGYGVHKAFESTTYTASARLVFGGSVPQDASWAAALAGTVEGIATSPGRLQTALADAGATRNILKFTKGVDTQSLSDSSVLELSVTDTNARVATSVANTLATGAVATLNAQQLQPSQSLLNQLQGEIEPLQTQIAAIDARMAADGASSPYITRLLVQRTDASQQLTALMTKQADVQQQVAQSVGASVIEAAAVPTLPDPSRLPLDFILGTLAGLLIGVGLAVLLETLRPTLAGREAIERALDAPVLGVLPGKANASGTVLALSARLRRAAEHAKTPTAVLWNGDEDLSDVAQRLQGAKPTALRSAGRLSFSVRAAVPGEAVNPRWGLVVVVPPVLPLRTLEEVDALRTGEGMVVLGAIIRPQRRRLQQPRTWWRSLRSDADTQERSHVDDGGEQASAVLVS